MARAWGNWLQVRDFMGALVIPNAAFFLAVDSAAADAGAIEERIAPRRRGTILVRARILLAAAMVLVGGADPQQVARSVRRAGVVDALQLAALDGRHEVGHLHGQQSVVVVADGRPRAPFRVLDLDVRAVPELLRRRGAAGAGVGRPH